MSPPRARAFHQLAVTSALMLSAVAASTLTVLAQEGSEEVKVERVKPPKERRPTLRFLKENRDFLRAQLDLLRQIAAERQGRAEILSDRDLMLQDMLAAIRAAQDTVAVEQARVEQWELLTSVRQLGDLEAQLDLMDRLLGDQQARLGQLEADFMGRQETALVILLRGYPDESGPTAIVLEEAGEPALHVPLAADDQAALRAGRIAQIFHEFVEPREHVWSVSFEGPGWTQRPPCSLTLRPTRDHLTFLELDLTRLQEDEPDLARLATVWEK